MVKNLYESDMEKLLEVSNSLGKVSNLQRQSEKCHSNE